MEKKEKFGYIFSICGLTLVIVFLIFLYNSGVLFAGNQTAVSSVPLGSSTKLFVKDSSSAVASFEVNGALLPGEELSQKIGVFNNGESALNLRAKAFFYTQDMGEVEVALKTSENWIKNDDGYYYLNQLALPNETIALASKLVLNKDYVLRGNNKYIINVLVESLDSELNIERIWLK